MRMFGAMLFAAWTLLLLRVSVRAATVPAINRRIPRPLEAVCTASAGAGLVLSGHTHGGQIWPFGCLVSRSCPQLAGRYEVGGATVFVGRGTGTWGPRMRLWQRGEILRSR